MSRCRLKVHLEVCLLDEVNVERLKDPLLALQTLIALVHVDFFAILVRVDALTADGMEDLRSLQVVLKLLVATVTMTAEQENRRLEVALAHIEAQVSLGRLYLASECKLKVLLAACAGLFANTSVQAETGLGLLVLGVYA